MNFTTIKKLVTENKKLYTDARLPEVYCYFAIKALYDDYNNNKRNAKEIIDGLNRVEAEFKRSCEEYEAYNKAIAHVGEKVKAKLTDGTIITGKVHALVFYSPNKYSVELIAENGCLTSVGAKQIIYEEENNV